MVQATRTFAQTGRLETRVIRPLLSDRFPANADGTLPDMAHPPLPVLMGAGTLRALRQTANFQGGQTIAFLSLAAFVFGIGACALLARQLFGPNVGFLAGAFYALAAPSGLGFAAAPSPIPLGTLLLTVLFLVLHKIDSVPMAGQTVPKSTLWLAGAAGALSGFLYLTIYSTLALIPLFLWHLWRVGGREKAALIAAFASVWLLVCGPYLVRNTRLTRNPVYNSRLFELTMHLPSGGQSDFQVIYQNTNLYHEADLPQTTARFMARGGAAQIGRKALASVAGLINEAPRQIGVFVLPLFLGAALSRFPDARTNRLQNLAYAALLCHGVGLSFFLPAGEAAAYFRLYAPLGAGFAAAFLLAIVRARNLPTFYARAFVWGWAIFACFGGAAALLGAGIIESDKPAPPPTPAAFYAIKAGGEMRLRSRDAFLLTNQPECAADVLNAPVALLPSNSQAVQTLQTRLGKNAGGVILTPLLDTPPDEITPSALAPWADLTRQIVQLRNITAGLTAKTRRDVVQQKQVFYPAAIRGAMRTFPRPVPFAEPHGKTTLIFWNEPSLNFVQDAGSNQEP